MDLCGRSQKVLYYTLHHCPHPAAPDESTDDMFKRNKFGELELNLLLLVDGRSNPFKRRHVDPVQQRKKEEEDAQPALIDKKAATADATSEKYRRRLFTAQDWAQQMRDDVEDAPKTICARLRRHAVRHGA